MAIERISRVSLRCDKCGLCYATKPARARISDELRLRASFEGWRTGPQADLCALCADGRLGAQGVRKRRAWQAVIDALRTEPGPDGLPEPTLLSAASAEGTVWTGDGLRTMEKAGVLRPVSAGHVIREYYPIRVVSARWALCPEEDWPAWCRALFSSAVDDPEQPEHEDHDQNHAQR